MVAGKTTFLSFRRTEAAPKCQKIPTIKHASAQDQDLFEFLTDFSSEMCAADDIFFCGKLLPHTTPSLRKANKGDDSRPDFCKQREPLNWFDGPDEKGWATRVSYQKLEKVSSPSEPSTVVAVQSPKRVSSGKHSGCGDFSSRKASRPKWYILMLGSVKAPSLEMEMVDIRWRLRRRATEAADDGLQTVAVSRGDKGSRGWKLLGALSCQGQANAVITPSVVVQRSRV